MKNVIKSENKAITLVALVITIIVLLILAGISISLLTQTGIFEKVKQSAQISKNAQEQENEILSEHEDKINDIVASIGIAGMREQNENNYSTEEQAIGTWIDGKTVFQRVYTYNGELIKNTNKILGKVDYDIDNIISADVTTKWSDGYTISSGCYVSAGTVYATGAYYDITNKQFYIKSDGTRNNIGAIVIYKYTKK